MEPPRSGVGRSDSRSLEDAAQKILRFFVRACDVEATAPVRGKVVWPETALHNHLVPDEL